MRVIFYIWTSLIFSISLFGLSPKVFAQEVNCRILHIGDSQVVGYPGHYMSIAAQAARESMGGPCIYDRSLAITGSSVKTWINKLDIIVRKMETFRPSVIFINLGGNDSYRAESSVLAHDIQFFNFWLSDLPSQVIWIGPPKSCKRTPEGLKMQKNRQKVSDKIKSIVGPKIFVDSSDVPCKYERHRDGIHFKASGAKEYIKFIWPRILKLLDSKSLNNQ
jgi:lysophospholipase L1-like esterase